LAPASGSAAGAAAAQGQPVGQGNPNLVTMNGMTYYRPQGEAAPATGGAAPAAFDGGTRAYAGGALTGPGVGPSTQGPQSAENFVPPEAWAPIPPREDGRMYVRLSMSSACVAEIFPGPIQARTGDLLLVPFGATSLSVKSPCGGLAEIYWGKEAKPRFSEVFGRNQAIKFEFKNQ
jgi:hypothetical protein